MGQNRRELLKKIQELEFAAVELTLYLDTHPEDEKALEMYNELVDEIRKAHASYEAAYGPLMAYGCSKSRLPWQWVEEPWPWEM